MAVADGLESGLAAASNDAPAPAESTPTTVDEALDRAFAPEPAGETATPEPGDETPAAPDAPAPAIAEPPAETPDPVETGPIPFERHKAALDNARTKTRDEVVAQIQQQYGGPLEVAQRLRDDFSGTMAQLLDEAIQHPEFGPALVKKAAQIVSSRRGVKAEATPETDPEPEPDYQTPEGDPVYSAARQKEWAKWNQRQHEAKLTAQFAPLQALQQQIQQQAQLQQLRTEATTRMQQKLSAWDAVPGFTEHRAAIAARQAELFKEGHDTITALGIAYAQIVPPQLQAKQTTEWVEAAGVKARATTPNPAASVPAQPRTPRTPDEALDQVFDAFRPAS